MKQSSKVMLFSILTSITLFINTMGVMPTYAAPIATEAVTKSGTAGTVPDGGVGSQTVDWVIDYDLTSSEPLTNLTLTDTWSAGQTLVPGSVETPGGTWSFNQPDSTSITFTNPLVAPNGQGAGIPLSIPLSGPVSFSGAGDGFNPAVTTSGKILGINHHTSNAGIWCYDLNMEASCSGYKMFPGINTTTASVVRAIGNKIYIVGSDIGTGSNTQPGYIHCWDTDTDSLCGTSPHLTAFDRLEVANGLLYTLLATGEVDCFDPNNALARCSGYPVQVNVPAASSNLGNGILADGNSLYVLNWNGQLNCLNISTLAFCSGWSSTPISGPLAQDILFPRLNAGGDFTGICQVGAGTAATCYDLDGANPTTVNDMALVATGNTYSFAGDSAYFGSRVYITGYANNIGCWDWALNSGQGAVCTGDGFDSNGHVTDTNLINSLVYGISHDVACLYSFGDSGSLFSIDPDTGQTPCTRSSGEVTVDIDDFYNAAPGAISATWNNVLLTDIDLTPGVEFDSLSITVIDPSDNSIVAGPTEMTGGAGVVDISSVSSSIRELKLQVVAKPVGTAAWLDSISPKIWLTFASDTPIQFSYQTTVTCAGSSQNLTNTINTILDPHSVQASVSACAYDTAGPTVDSFSVNSPSSSLDIPITAFTASDNIGVTGYMITKSSTAPAAGDAGWSGSAPTTYTVASVGSYTLYPWAKDAAGNISAVYGSPVTVSVAIEHTLILKSVASNDGWVRESSETSNEGGILSFNKEIAVGDDSGNRQLRSFLHFDTSSLPDGAVITSVRLRVKSINVIGTNPFDTLGNIIVDIRDGAFSDDLTLQLSDFRAPSSLNAAGVIRNTPDVNNWYIVKLKTDTYPMFLNGDTQFRLRFPTDDNNNSTADYIRFYSGDAEEASQPRLIIMYTLPTP